MNPKKPNSKVNAIAIPGLKIVLPPEASDRMLYAARNLGAKKIAEAEKTRLEYARKKAQAVEEGKLLAAKNVGQDLPFNVLKKGVIAALGRNAFYTVEVDGRKYQLLVLPNGNLSINEIKIFGSGKSQEKVVEPITKLSEYTSIVTAAAKLLQVPASFLGTMRHGRKFRRR